MNDVDEKINRLELMLQLSRAEITDLSSRLDDAKNQAVKAGEATFSPPPYYCSRAKDRVIAFGCTNSGLVITVKVGKVYFKGVSKAIGSTPVGWPNVTIASTTYGYLSINLADGSVTWGTSASDPGDGDDDTEIWRIFAATVSSGAITELLECQHGDIHCMGNA